MRLALSFAENFLGHAPGWYKLTILGFLALNPMVFAFDARASAWLLVVEFIFTLAMALKCYPLQPGGLLAIEAVAIGLTTDESVLEEVVHNFEVVLLLIFMVAGVFFLKQMLLFVFTKILVDVRSKAWLSLLFCLAAAALSAFLDALTVTAVVITVATGFYTVYHKVASGKSWQSAEHDAAADGEVGALHREDLAVFRAFLRSLVMHAAVGTALGGMTTMVGEPQNLLIASEAGWDFGEFFRRMLPVSMPVLTVGSLTCVMVERLRWFGYGARLPDSVRRVLADFVREESRARSRRESAVIAAQFVVAGLLVTALAAQWAPVGLVGLAVIVLATAFSGITDEHRIGTAFREALPFTALLTVFFAIVAVIDDQRLFDPMIEWVLTLPKAGQPGIFFLANGALSAISDNVFVATVYMNEISGALASGAIDRAQFDALAIAINTGTNLPSVATPNGQAAFLFLLTSALAPLIRLSYVRMIVMAFPYAVVMTAAGFLCVVYLIA